MFLYSILLRLVWCIDNKISYEFWVLSVALNRFWFRVELRIAFGVGRAEWRGTQNEESKPTGTECRNTE
jgi:hypothetical protein